MSTLPLNKIWQTKLLQEDYNKTMSRLQEVIKREMELYWDFLDEEGISVLPKPYPCRYKNEDITQKEISKMFEEWKKRK